jgi:hypothetical protein
MPDEKVEPIPPSIVIPRNTIPDYKTDEYFDAHFTWKAWADHGVLPFAGGWAEQPWFVREIVDIFDSVYGYWQQARGK